VAWATGSSLPSLLIVKSPTASVGGLGLAHEVDVEVGRHRRRDRPQPAHDQQIEAEVGQPDQGRARDRAAWPQMLFLGRQADTDRGVVEMLDPEVEMGRLREVLI
jgi:hypothetical protein